MITGRFSIDPQVRDTFTQFAQEMVVRQSAQAGCLSFGIFEDVSAPNTYLMLEQWESIEAFDRYNRTEAFEDDDAELNGFILGEASYDEYEFSVPPGMN